MGNCTCCSYPNGCITLGPSLLIFPALLLTFWGVFSCNYVNYTTEKANEITAIGLFWKSVPSFTYEDATGGDTYFVSTCTPYNWFGEDIIQYDGPFRAARGLGLIAVLFGCVMTVVVWVIASCIPISKMGWRVIGLILGAIGVFQLFTLLLLSSKVCSSSCTNLGSGGITSIVSGVLWIASGILCFLVGEPVEDEGEQIIQVTAATGIPATNNAYPESQSLELPMTQANQVLEQTTTEQRVEKDGTVVIEKTTTRTDGSVTVTTEVIPPQTVHVASAVAGKI